MDQIAEAIEGTSGIVLAAFSGQNIDRFVSFYKAALKAKRSFVADFYLAYLLRVLARPTLPDPTSGALRVYLPRMIKRKIARQRLFDLVDPYRGRRIYPRELQARAGSLVMSFRSSMVKELEEIDCLKDGKLIYSMWPGYLTRGDPDLSIWCQRQGMTFEIIHTSGHADGADLARLVDGIKPQQLIPIHTLAPTQFDVFAAKVVRARDGQWIEVRQS